SVARPLLLESALAGERRRPRGESRRTAPSKSDCPSVERLPIHAGSAVQLVSMQAELSERSQEVGGRRPATVADWVARTLIFGSYGQHVGTFGKAHRRVTARRCRHVTPSKASARRLGESARIASTWEAAADSSRKDWKPPMFEWLAE